MVRLNQSRRQKIGYSYCPQVINDVTLQPKMRNMALVQDQAFTQNMKGEGVKDIIRGIIDNKKEILDLGKSAVDIASRIQFDKPKGSGLSVAGGGLSVAGGGLSVAGGGLSVAGGSRGSVQPSVGGGLSVAGGGLKEEMGKVWKKKQKSLGMNSLIFGNGLSLAGGAACRGGSIDIRGNQKEPELPGDALKKKLLQKMLRERKMKALGDRVKSAPIEAGMNGGSLVIPTINNKMGSQSMSKTLPSSKGYKLNPRPLVGAGISPAELNKMIKHLQINLIPILKSKKLLPSNVKNSDQFKKLVGMKVKKIINEGVDDPEKIMIKVVETLKPVMKGKGLNLAGEGLKESIGRMIGKILWGSFKMTHPNSVFVKGFAKQEGGFIIAGLIALGSIIAAAASAAAATTVVGTVTVGSLAGAFATGAAGAAGAAIAKKIAGGGLKDTIVKVAQQTKIAYRDLSQADKDKLKSEFEKLKQNKSKAGVIDFAKSIAPIALKATQQKLQPEFAKAFKKAGLSGSGLKIAGQGLGLAGKGDEKQFKNEFVKNMVEQLGV